MAEQLDVTKLVHPEYSAYATEWLKYWLAYEGGRDFIDLCLKRYSKRETKKDFDNRKDVTYNPPESQSALNDVRDALVARLHEVARTGDQRYLDMMTKDVDTFRSSMSTFIGQEILPRLLAQSKVYVYVDAPPASELAPGMRPPTIAEDKTRPPYLWAFAANQCRAWTYDDRGRITSCLIERMEDVVDATTGLTVDAELRYVLLKLLAPGEMLVQQVGPGVAVIEFDKQSKVLSQALLNLPRVPVVEFRIAQALMTDIAAIQIALLNLSSTDMAFLFRGNFPLYTEQYDPATDVIRPTARKRDSVGAPSQDRDVDDQSTEQGSSVGVGKGRRYPKGVERPGYVSPPTENLRASMEKQKDLAGRIRAACDLALVSLSVAAVEQSGESKKQDRVGLSAGLRYIATQLENGEREVNDIVHAYLGVVLKDATVTYPTEYEVEDEDERMKALERLVKSREAVRSATYQKELSKQIVRVQLQGVVEESVIAAAEKEIDESPFMDESVARSTMVQGDVNARIASKETAAALRGYGPEENAKRLAEDELDADKRAGFGSGSGGDVRPFGFDKSGVGAANSSQQGAGKGDDAEGTKDDETEVPE